MNIKKGVVAGFLAGVAMMIADMAVWQAAQGYLMPLYQASASLWKPMEPMNAWLAKYLSLLVAEGILFGLVYSVLYNGIPGKNNLNRGTKLRRDSLAYWNCSRDGNHVPYDGCANADNRLVAVWRTYHLACDGRGAGVCL